MKNLDLKKVLGIISFILRCPICGFRNNLETMKVVDSEQVEGTSDARLVIHSDCQKCQGSVMFTIGVMGPEITSAAAVTDLTLGDTHRFRELEPINTDDVMGLHASLKSFKGDFIKAFKKSQQKNTH